MFTRELGKKIIHFYPHTDRKTHNHRWLLIPSLIPFLLFHASRARQIKISCFSKFSPLPVERSDGSDTSDQRLSPLFPAPFPPWWAAIRRALNRHYRRITHAWLVPAPAHTEPSHISTLPTCFHLQTNWSLLFEVFALFRVISESELVTLKVLRPLNTNYLRNFLRT